MKAEDLSCCATPRSVEETKEAFILIADLPGVKQSDVEVRL